MAAGEYSGRPVSDGLAEKSVGIHIFTDNGDKEVFPFHLPGIQADMPDGRILLSHKKCPACGQD